MNAPIHRSMTAAEWAMLVTLAILWGGSYFYIGVAVKELPPLSIVAFRVAGAALLLYPVVRLAGQAMPSDAATWRAFFVMGLLNNVVPFSLIAWAQGHVASGLAAILNATTPLFAVVLANFLTRDERITPARAAGVVVGFAGAVVMIGPDALHGFSGDLLADLALLLASVFYALSPIYGRRFARQGTPPMVAATGQFIAATVMMAPLALIVDRPWTFAMPSPQVWAALVALVILSTVVGYILYYRILATAGAVNLMLVTFLVPVSAILLGALFLHERLALNQVIGMAGIAAGLMLIDGRVVRWAVGRAS